MNALSSDTQAVAVDLTGTCPAPLTSASGAVELKTRDWKSRDWKTRDWKRLDRTAGLENADWLWKDDQA